MKAFEKSLVFVVPLIDCMERVAVVNQMQQANYFNRKSNTSQPWFSEQYGKLRQSIRQPIQPKKSRGMKL